MIKVAAISKVFIRERNRRKIESRSLLLQTDNYSMKKPEYFDQIRHDLISQISGTGHKVLEVGCGTGATLIELKKLKIADEVVGVELHANAATANQILLDNFITGNIEQIELPYPPEHFSVMIFADVLEHLQDPWTLVRTMQKYLHPNGLLIASIPNIRYFRALYSVAVKGDFRYTDSGILDKTHLRFFCKKNIIALFNGPYTLTKITPAHRVIGGRVALFDYCTLGLFEEFLTCQYIVCARKQIGSIGI